MFCNTMAYTNTYPYSDSNAYPNTYSNTYSNTDTNAVYMVFLLQ